MQNNLSREDSLVFLNHVRSEVKNENEMTLSVIRLLARVEKDRLYLEWRYDSLFEFATKDLKYEETSALRRMAAARLMLEVPEVESKIESGLLHLAQLCRAQTFFRQEESATHKKIDHCEKLKVLSQLEEKSTRQSEKTLFAIFPDQIHKTEKVRIVSENHTEIKLVLDDSVKHKLDRLKQLMSHKNPNMSYGDLISELADIALVKFEKAGKVAKTRNVAAAEMDENRKVESPAAPPVRNVTDENAQSRHISVAVQREVWKKDEWKCSFVSPVTGKVCGSKWKLEIHHILPFAMSFSSGESEVFFSDDDAADVHDLANLKLFCKNHNLHQAKKDYGEEKIRSYLRH